MGYPALRRWNHQLSFRAGINSAGSTSRTIATLAMISRCGQKEEWLRPLAAGESRSCFMMTEPAPGAGSDPSMLRTTARRDGADFIIDGTKWLITGAVGAELAIIMAKNNSDALGPHGATMFLSPMRAAGIHIERVLDTLDRFMAGGHAVVRLDGLRSPRVRCWGGSARAFAMPRCGSPRRV
jgi:acyl-CoA dehydrogenase